MAAEGPYWSETYGEIRERQWGRDRLAAEGMYPRGGWSRKGRVNGAATVWPRKEKKADAEREKNLASMGPRPFGRGR